MFAFTSSSLAGEPPIDQYSLQNVASHQNSVVQNNTIIKQRDSWVWRSYLPSASTAKTTFFNFLFLTSNFLPYSFAELAQPANNTKQPGRPHPFLNGYDAANASDTITHNSMSPAENLVKIRKPRGLSDTEESLAGRQGGATRLAGEEVLPAPNRRQISGRGRVNSRWQPLSGRFELSRPRLGAATHRSADWTDFFSFTHDQSSQLAREGFEPPPARGQLSARNFVTEHRWQPSPDQFELPRPPHLQRQGSGDSGFSEATDMDLAARRAQTHRAFPHLEPSDAGASSSRGPRCRRSVPSSCGDPQKSPAEKKKAMRLKKQKLGVIKTASLDKLSTSYAKNGAARRFGGGRYFRRSAFFPKKITKISTTTVRVAGRWASRLMPKVGIADIALKGGEVTLYVIQNNKRWLSQHHLEARFRSFDDIYGGLSIFFGNPIVDLLMPKDMERRNAKAFVEEQLVFMVKEVAKIDPSYLPELITSEGPLQPDIAGVDYKTEFQSGLELDAARDLPIQMIKMAVTSKAFELKEYADGSVLIGSNPIIAGEQAFFVIAKKDPKGNFKIISMGAGMDILEARLERLEQTLTSLQKRLAVVQSAYSGHIRKEVKVPSYSKKRSDCRRKNPNINLQAYACSSRRQNQEIDKVRREKRKADQQNSRYENQLQAMTDDILKSLLEEHARLTVSISELKEGTGSTDTGDIFQQRIQSLIDAKNFHELEEAARKLSLQEINAIPEHDSQEAKTNREKAYQTIEKASKSLDRLIQNLPRSVAEKLLSGMEGSEHCNAANPFIEIKKQLLADVLAVSDEFTTEKIELPFSVTFDQQVFHNYVLGTNGVLIQHAEGLVPEAIDEGKMFNGIYQGPRKNRLNEQLKYYLRYSTDNAVKAYFVQQPAEAVESGKILHLAVVKPANGCVQHWQQFTPEVLLQPKMCPAADSSQAAHNMLRKLSPDDKQSLTNAALSGNDLPQLVLKRSDGSAEVIGSMLAPVLSLKNGHFNPLGYQRVPFYQHPHGHLYACQAGSRNREEISLSRYEVDWPEASLPTLHKVEVLNGVETTNPVTAGIEWVFSQDRQKIVLNRRFLSELRFYPKGEVQSEKQRYRSSVYHRFKHMRCHWRLSLNNPSGEEQRTVASFKITHSDVRAQRKVIELAEPLEPGQESELVFSCQYRTEQSLLPKFWRYASNPEKRVKLSANLAPGFYRLQGTSHSEKLVITGHDWQRPLSPIKMPDSANNRLMRQKSKLSEYADRQKIRYRKYWKAFFNGLNNTVPEAGNVQEVGVYTYRRVLSADGSTQLVPDTYINREFAVITHPRNIRNLMACLDRLPNLDRETFDFILQVAMGVPRRYQRQFVEDYFHNPVAQAPDSPTHNATEATQEITEAMSFSAPVSGGHFNRKLMAQRLESVAEETAGGTRNRGRVSSADIEVLALGLGAGLLLNDLDVGNDTVGKAKSIDRSSLERWLYINQVIFESGVAAHKSARAISESMHSYSHCIRTHLERKNLGEEVITKPVIEFVQHFGKMPINGFYGFIHQHSKILLTERPESAGDTVAPPFECPIAPYAILCELFDTSKILRRRFDQAAYKLQQLGVNKEDITVSDVLAQIPDWQELSEMQLPMTVYRHFQKMTPVTDLEATLLIEKDSDEKRSRFLGFDAHGKTCHQKLLAMKKANLLSKDIVIRSSVYGFFQQKIVQELVNSFYQNTFLNRDAESLLKGSAYVSDVYFYKVIDASVAKNKKRQATINRAFRSGCFITKQGERLSIAEVPPALLEKTVVREFSDRLIGDPDSIEYKKNITDHINRCRAQLAAVIAKITKDPGVYWPACPEYPADNGNHIAAKFFAAQKHSTDGGILSKCSMQGLFIMDRQTVSAYTEMKMSLPAPDYFGGATFQP